ncbi:MAG: ChbG/HpnK family deacetylase [Candidatus Acidiferrales bacterium]
MLIINADDWGGWKSATDAALKCFKKGRITSVTAMVFMEDSERAATLARETGVDVGLHLNLDTPFTSGTCPERVRRRHEPVCRWLRSTRYSQLVYNPFLCGNFRDLYEVQVAEFARLYGRKPSHIDGHHHMHLCANMLWEKVVPSNERIRRNFSFWPGEKSSFNRLYRGFVDKRLARCYRTTDYFFSLSRCLDSQRAARVEKLAGTSNVELMTHPEKTEEYNWLMGDEASALVSRLKLCSYAQL